MSTADFLRCLWPSSNQQDFDISAITYKGQEIPVEESDLLHKPFCTLKRFRCAAAVNSVPVLIVAPISGQYATLLRDTVAGLLPDHLVYITDWLDARQIPVTAGSFNLDDNIAYVIDFLRLLAPEIHVLAVCQSAVPVLAAVALLAAEGGADQPRSLILMGGLIDTRINPTRVDRWAETLAFRWLEQSVISQVPIGLPGYLRPVYPAYVQRAALITYLARHIGRRVEAPWELHVYGDATLAEPRFCRELLRLMDVPAELFLSNIRVVLQEQALPRGTMTWQGEPVRPSAIHQTALMTVEGEFDDISGRGQTYAAHDLCRSVSPHKRRHHMQRGIGHFGMYAGKSWFTKVLPPVRDFIQAQS